MSPDGPRRFVGALYDAFDADRAMETVAFADRFYRAPADDGFEETLDHVAFRLREAGYGRDEGLELEVIETDLGQRAWTPRRARIGMRIAGESEEEVLHLFEGSADRDRTVLPQNAPPANVAGMVVFGLEDLDSFVESGEPAILVTEAQLFPDLLGRAKALGASAVVSASLASFNVDPTGAGRHLDAVQYRVLRDGSPLPVAQISPRSYARLRDAHARTGRVELSLVADVDYAERPLRTLVAAVVGKDRPDQAVVIGSHLQEPGACDNASGVAGLTESACNLIELLRSGAVDWPSRTIVFLWGHEKVMTREWLEHTDRHTVAGISSDMTGQDRARTGAIALLERMPDPGAISVLPPDAHTPWGARHVSADELVPTGINVMARCAMADTNAVAGGAWESREHPWEGGSDHDVFIEHGVPAVLFWHFTDFAYHTSLDRMENVDPQEIRRTAVALLATALALADPRPADLERYLECVRNEEALRIAAAEEAEEEEAVQLWREWCDGARTWLRAQCLGLAEPGGGGRK
jgi:hypothetical protein